MTAILYAAKGGSSASDLYSLDSANGNETSIGPTSYALTGMAIDPTSEILYGVTSNQSPVHNKALISIDPTDGSATYIGQLLHSGNQRQILDIAFNSSGILYGVGTGSGNSSNKLYTIDLTTGVLTLVGTITGMIFTSIYGGGFSVNSSSITYLFPDAAPGPSYGGDYYTLNLTTAVCTSAGTLSNDPYFNSAPISAASFDSSDELWMILNNFGVDTSLCTVNLSTGVITVKGAVLAGMDALVWGLGEPPSPPTAVTGNASFTGTGIKFTGTVNPSATFHFEYGSTISYGTSTTPASASASGKASTTIPYDVTLPGVIHYRLVSGTANGDDKTIDTADLILGSNKLILVTPSGAITRY